MEIWLRSFHNNLECIPYSTIPIEKIWNVIMMSDKYMYMFSRKPLAVWFRNWCNNILGTSIVDQYRSNVKFYRSLLFLCYAFDHAHEYYSITKLLAYECRQHIQEHNPTSYQQMHLPIRVMGELFNLLFHKKREEKRSLFD